MGLRKLFVVDKIFTARRARRLWPLVPFAALLLVALDASARAGGGENYVGGGDSTPSGGGGGGDGIAALVYLAFAYPEVGVPVLIIVVIVSLVKRKRNPDRTTSFAVTTLEQIGAADTSALEEVKSRDPGFDESAFLSRVAKTEGLVQKAWCAGDMSGVRNLLSDGLFRRFETQLAILKHHKKRNVMADHRILRTRIHAAEHDAHFDTIHVAVEAEARDVEVSAGLDSKRAQEAALKAPLGRYTEIWSFLRRPGAITAADKNLADGACPSCGAPLEAGQTSKCEHCQAIVNSGEYDWVLAEITQPIEWRPSSIGAVPGLAELSEADPGFNRQSAEDRASYVFWRWIEALVTGETRPLAKCASARMQKSLEETLQHGGGTYFKVAVGSVDLVACEKGQQGGRDRVHVKILWSSARTPDGAPSPAAKVMTLARDAGAQDSGGLSYARCPECQAPLTENDSPQCDYCDAELTAGKKDWVLEKVLFPEELRVDSSRAGTQHHSDTAGWQLPTWITPDMGNPRERRLLLMRMAAVMMADGVVTKEEHKLLRTASKRWGLSLDAIRPILDGQVDAETVNTMRPSDPAGFFSGLVSAALIDGRVDAKEEKLLLDVSRNLGMEETEARSRISTLVKMAKEQRLG